jgi:hypothetical protein
MNPIFRNYILPFVLIGVLLGGWEYSKPNRPVKAAEDYGPPPPRNPNEGTFQDHRRFLRVSTLKSLEQPWSSFCQAEGRRTLLSSLNGYFYHRGGQEDSYPARWGDVGKTYITREWSSTDDRRIEQLTQVLYYRGYLDLKALDPRIASRVAAKLTGLPVTEKPCKS